MVHYPHRAANFVTLYMVVNKWLQNICSSSAHHCRSSLQLLALLKGLDLSTCGYCRMVFEKWIVIARNAIADARKAAHNRKQVSR